MKRTLFTLVLMFTLVSSLYISNTFAQDYTQWELPEDAKARLGKGHINEIAYSPDGTRLAVASSIGIWIYDAGTGEEIDLLTGHTSSVRSVAFSPDGTTLASGSDDETIRLWEANTGRHIRTLTGHTGYVFSVAFSPDGTTLASGSGDYTIRLWEANTGRHIRTFIGHTDWVLSVSFSPDGTTLASGSSDGTVLLWKVTPSAPQLPEDVNEDGIVNIIDLTLVASNFGETGANAADVNGDGVVNIVDLTLVAAAFGNTAAAPIVWSRNSETDLTRSDVAAWLKQAQQLNLTDPTFQRGVRVLEQLLAAMTPKETTLLPNYPNPFNPETWIPYQLATPAEVTLTIYAANGKVVRTIALGNRPAGIYQNKNRAAYWDGKNKIGEPVASGVYYYTLTAGDFTATRKMLIRK